jgi:hypothetical protein
MFANLIQLLSHRLSPEPDPGFVKDVRVRQVRVRNPRLERRIKIGWAVIAVKSVLVVWLVDHYHIPFSPLWVIVPTVIFATAVSIVYYCSRD